MSSIYFLYIGNDKRKSKGYPNAFSFYLKDMWNVARKSDSLKALLPNQLLAKVAEQVIMAVFYISKLYVCGLQSKLCVQNLHIFPL